MRCKKCNAQLEKGAAVCPECGEERKKRFVLPIWAAICIAVLAVAILVLGVLFVVDAINNKDENPLKSYTASAEELVKHKDRVVAKAGKHELTNAELQVYYWICVYSFIEENSYYVSLMGLDYTKDLGTQECYLQKGISWQEYFIDKALASWYQYIVLNIAAEEAEFKLSKDEQDYLDNLWDTMTEQAKKYGYKDAQDMIEQEMGAGATFDAYIQYSKETFVGMGYYEAFIESIKVTEEDIAKHYEENIAEYEKNGVAKKGEAYCVSVRHILISPVTKDADGNTIDTEVAWENCRQEAQKLLDEYLKGGKIDEEAFALLAKEHTTDTSSKANGGLYAQFARGEMVQEFEDWSFDATRQYGDTGLVKSQYGYHIMFFVDKDETYCSSVRHILISPVVTKDENDKEVITEAAWADCKAKAQKLLDEYLKSGKIDEEAFASLADTNTEDPGSKGKGGLYTDFVRGQMVKEFEAWSFDAARQYGDTGLVKTTHGYHIMFFVGHEEQWHYYADYELRMDESNEMMDKIIDEYAIDADYNKILIGHVSLG